MEHIDIKAKIENLGVRRHPIYPGMRFSFQIKENNLTTGMLDFNGELKGGETTNCDVWFISPKYYPNSLWVGKKIAFLEGSRIAGYITVTEILNPVLDKDGEKWILLDGRNIFSKSEFDKLIYPCMEKEKEEVLHIVWIFAVESKKILGFEIFDKMVATIKGFENVELELCDEHVWE